MKQKTLVRILLGLIPFTILVLSLLIVFQEKYTLFPGQNGQLIFSARGSLNGDGKENLVKVDNHRDEISIEYMINNSLLQNPLQLNIPLLKDSQYSDLSGFDYLKVTANTSRAWHYQFMIQSGQTQAAAKHEQEYDPVKTDIYLLHKTNTYRIPLKKLAAHNRGVKDRLEKASLLSIIDTREKMNMPVSSEKVVMTIKKIEFVKSKMLFITAASVLLYVYILLLVSLIFNRIMKRKMNHNYEEFNHSTVIESLDSDPEQTAAGPVNENLQLANDKQEELQRIMKMINDRYNDPDLTIKDIEQEKGISINRISVLIKEKYMLSFNQLINKIRISEAKRLLTETDQNISDISSQVGFNHLSYFCKIFKDIEGISPSQFREYLNQ